MNTKEKLPERLHAAYDWTASAGELSMLANLHGLELREYCNDAEGNAWAHGVMDVDAHALEELADWLGDFRRVEDGL